MSASVPAVSGLSVNPMDRYKVLLGAIIVQLVLGTIYGYSIFWVPLQSELFPQVITAVQAQEMPSTEGFEVVADEAALKAVLQTQRGYLKYAFSICVLSFAITMVLAGRLQDIKGPRFTALLGAVLMGGGFMVAGLLNHSVVFYLAHAAFCSVIALILLMIFHALTEKMDKEAVPMLQYIPFAIMAGVIVGGLALSQQYVGKLGTLDRLFMLWGTVGFLAGAGVGFAYVCPIAALIKWFPDQKGLVSGIAVAGFGFGAFLIKGRDFGGLGFIERYDITPFFMIHGLICFVGVATGALLLKNPPNTPAAVINQSNDSWRKTLRTPAFYVIWLMFFSGAMAGLMVIGIAKDFASEQLIAAAGEQGFVSDQLRAELLVKGAAAIGWLAIFNALGRVAWGFISDKIGRTPALVAMFLLQAAVMIALAGMKTEFSLAVGASLVGFNFGGNFALFPSITADLFGARNFGANYGWVFTSYGIAGVVGIAAGNTAKVMTGSYSVAFTVAAVLCIISAMLALSLRWLGKPAEPVTA